MSDKIEEIRARHDLSASWSNGYSDRATLLAEIERLRADLVTQQNCCDGAAAQDAHIRREREEHRAEVAKLRAENERLRAENERVTRYVGLVLEKRIQFSEALTSIAQNTCRDGCQEAARVARNALEGKP